MLEQKVQCRCVLALTATATKATEADVAKVLQIEPCNIVRDSNVRDNLRLSVTHQNGGMSHDKARMFMVLCICIAIFPCKSLILFTMWESSSMRYQRNLKTQSCRVQHLPQKS